MMCCNECPFNPKTGKAKEKCSKPVCKCSSERKKDTFCARSIGTRCFMDYYVLNNLSKGDKLAKELAVHTIQSALIGRDRALLIALFYVAPTKLRSLLWKWLGNNESRSLWMLNPIFNSQGLKELENLPEEPNQLYMQAIIGEENHSNGVQQNSMLRRLSHEL